MMPSKTLIFLPSASFMIALSLLKTPYGLQIGFSSEYCSCRQTRRAAPPGCAPFDVVNLHEPTPRTRSSKVEQKSGERVSPVDLDQ
jgi:hypothetical protein